MPSASAVVATVLGDARYVAPTSSGAGGARAVIDVIEGGEELAAQVLVAVGDELLGEVWVEVHGSAFRGWWFGIGGSGTRERACRARGGVGALRCADVRSRSAGIEVAVRSRSRGSRSRGSRSRCDRGRGRVSRDERRRHRRARRRSICGTWTGSWRHLLRRSGARSRARHECLKSWTESAND